MKKLFFPVVVFGLWATVAFAEAAVAGDPAYTLQVGAFARQASAENVASGLEGKGLAPYVTPNKRGIFTVRVGSFSSREEARQAAARLKAEGVLDSSLIVKTTLPPREEIPAGSPAPTTPEPSPEAAVLVTPPPAVPPAEQIEPVPAAQVQAAQVQAAQVQAAQEVTMGSRMAGALDVMARQPSSAQGLGFRAARIALDFLGVKYRLGGMSRENGMDCSGFVKTVYALCGIDLPRTSSDQFRHGQPVGRDELTAGDLVFFGRNERVNHVGIYLGEGKYIHAPRPKDSIRISNLEEKSTLRRFLGARRLLSDD